MSGGRVVMVMTHRIQEEILLPSLAMPGTPGRISNGPQAVAKGLRLTQKAEFVEAPPLFTGCEDSSDNKFFDCAIAGRLITS